MRVYDEINNCWVSHRHLPEYHARKRLVRDAWIGVGVFMLLLPLNFILALALLGCFLSFMFLDEKPYELKYIKVSDED